MNGIKDDDQIKFNKLMDGMETVNRQMVRKMPLPPMCHFRPMEYIADEWKEWWRCSVCGHTKYGCDGPFAKYEH